MQRCFLLGSVLICLCCAVVLWGATFYPRSESSAEMCAYWYICWVGGWPTFASPQPWLGAGPPLRHNNLGCLTLRALREVACRTVDTGGRPCLPLAGSRPNAHVQQRQRSSRPGCAAQNLWFQTA